MVNSLENIDKSKVYVDRIEGLDEVVEDVIGDTLVGAVSTITTSDLTAGKILVSDANGKVAASNKAITDMGGDGDNLSITKNASNELQAIGVINQNNTTEGLIDIPYFPVGVSAIKTWTGTKAQYDALKEQPSYYAWVDNYNAVFFTTSLTPSVGDTVYSGVNKEDTGYFIVYSFNSGNLVVESLVGATSYFPVTRDSSQDEIGQSRIDNNTLYNITDDASGTMNVYNKAEVDTLLNNKADINLSNISNNIDYVIETKQPTDNDLSWYRIYKSGWVEQGGRIAVNCTANIATAWNVNFPITMIDTNYNYSLALKSGWIYESLGGTENYTTTYLSGFINTPHEQGVILTWEVKGQKA